MSTKRTSGLISRGLVPMWHVEQLETGFEGPLRRSGRAGDAVLDQVTHASPAALVVIQPSALLAPVADRDYVRYAVTLLADIGLVHRHPGHRAVLGALRTVRSSVTHIWQNKATGNTIQVQVSAAGRNL